jgi:hypothetical protein
MTSKQANFLKFSDKNGLFTVLHPVELSRSRIVHSNGNFITDDKGLQNFGLCSAFGVFEQGGILDIVPHLL